LKMSRSWRLWPNQKTAPPEEADCRYSSAITSSKLGPLAQLSTRNLITGRVRDFGHHKHHGAEACGVGVNSSKYLLSVSGQVKMISLMFASNGGLPFTRRSAGKIEKGKSQLSR